MGNVATFGRMKKSREKASSGDERFDPTLLQSDGFVSRVIGRIVRNPYPYMAFLRRYWPIPTIGNWAFITRYDDVAEALQNDKQVAVPFGPKIEALNGGPNFVLGMADGPEYQGLKKETMSAFKRTDNEEIVAPFAYQEAKRLLEKGDGKIDAVSGLLTLVPTRICEEYYGLRVEDKASFGRWTIAMSTYMFGNPTDDPNLEEAAFGAAQFVRPIVDEAIDRAQASPGGDTITARLVERQRQNPEGMPDTIIRAILIGMVTGFVPTNTMASGHMLDLLLEKPDWMRQAREAARAGDDDLLQRILFEAMRFWPLNPGPFRVAAEDVVIAAGTSREKRIKKGTNILVSTQSAMHDPRRVENPTKFDPNRKQTDYMLMGFGLHWCIGAPLAYAQVTQTFKALLERDNVRRAPGKDGKLTTFGPFPESLWVEYD
ncbi:cytochrome P450 [Qipengyuania sp. S6317L1]|uniref:cytochrome P450 n=1 Tax=Qipengyuania sp. S6317L1 TaxID=2926410 RepID=UPI001FF66845|nr:cytochrome P450 [Qipengyuania sp. S6317L1]MCK0100101.1 cytochrome P450 [Qipengyuania sp. S6317L1]